CVNLCNNHAPRIASSVLPTAMLADITSDPAVVKLTRKDPAKIAGQLEVPNSSRSAMAIPAGAHTGDALTWTEAKRSPIIPAKKYAPVMSTITIAFLAGP